MTNLLSIIQMVVAVLLVVCILLQQRGSGLGGLLGGGGEGYHTKRGLEKTIFTATIILAFIFLALGLARLIIVQ
ncbi:preprotein translocase subunit SecG [Patescibacteria group bacterium]|nr:preprotein translocase subunit SecG [Patescibacteria group bacterium]